MEMTDFEIVSSYREAKKKKDQIEILSDLNCCSKERIIEILKENGVSPKELPRNRKKKVDTYETNTVPVAKEEPKAEEQQEVTMQCVIDQLASLVNGIEVEINKKSKAIGKIRNAAKLLTEADELM